MGHKVVVFDISVIRALWETRVRKHKARQKKEEERLEKSALEKIKEEWNFVAECRRKGIPQAEYCKNGFIDTSVRLLEKIEKSTLTRQSLLSRDSGKRSSRFVFELSGDHWKELPDSLKEQTHLREWHISDTLIQIIPTYIELFQAMRILDLPKNQISHLPAEIGCLKNLRELNVSFNHLTSIPPELGDCENLERLDCSGNLELTELPFELEELQSFLLYKNRLTYLPHSMLNLKKLTLLVVSGDHLVELPTALCDSSTPLKFVSLMDNPIDNIQCQDGDEIIESERDRRHFDKEFMKAYIEDLKERESVPSYTTKVSFSLQL
uniref:Leucine rich repeat containing 2 n=1 Tax=Propithecus coquereli TaxID=379532 RepID=A0A2K6FYY9_PROCO